MNIIQKTLSDGGQLKKLLIDRILKTPPISKYITPGSTPVVAFGDPIRAEIATVGINPSSREFLDAKGKLLTGSDRRLADFNSLGIKSLSELNSQLAERVLEDSNDYFQKEETIYKWFEPLEKYVLSPLGSSFRDYSATHLDLVQWSTAPVWGAIKDKTARAALIEDDIRFLWDLLRKGSFSKVLLNGRTVVDTLKKFGVVEIEQVGTTPIGKSGMTSALWSGVISGTNVPCLGWNLNLQHYRTTEDNRAALSKWIRRNI